jgi:hypothetical protein
MTNSFNVVNKVQEAQGDSENTNAAPRRAEGALHLADGIKTENRQYIKY